MKVGEDKFVTTYEWNGKRWISVVDLSLLGVDVPYLNRWIKMNIVETAELPIIGWGSRKRTFVSVPSMKKFLLERIQRNDTFRQPRKFDPIKVAKKLDELEKEEPLVRLG